ncbi:MAG: hypothetical protein IKW14_04460 [Phascolarctobacterium sp.]|nr:hypothetical protein [Phascolarctobacterium sp.]
MDFLNKSLGFIGLETHKRFRIDDDEFPELYYVDSFGDVYVVDEMMDDCENDYLADELTLGRLLTQYDNKIIVEE